MNKSRLFVLATLAVGFVGMASTNPSKSKARTTDTALSPYVTVSRPQHRLIRISQLDCQQYASAAECTEWSSSTCSTAAMIEVANYYDGPGRYRIHDLLAVESRIEAITPQSGLFEDAGIVRTMAFFGFRTSWGYGRSLDHIMQLARQGEPVIVSLPPDHYNGGHLVVVTGGTSDNVFLADSSIWNRHSISRAQFLSWWEGFSAVVTRQWRQG